MKKLLTLTLTLVALFIFISPGLAQEGQEAQKGRQAQGPPPLPIIPCPMPIQIIKMEATTATPYTPDFPPGPVPPLANFGGTATNQHFRHTFSWKAPSDCCQYVSGKLILLFKSLDRGESLTSADAGNDTVTIYRNGVNKVLPLPLAKLYSAFPFPVGIIKTKVIPLTQDMVADNRLSFLIQDDTSVISARLEVVFCCLRK